VVKNGSLSVGRKIAILLVAWSATAPLASGRPAQVILIRHAEKPAEGDGLSLKGQQRAAALVPYFLGTPEVLQYKTPVAIYAQKSTKGRPSLRPVQTVQGLADTLKLTLIQYPHDDFAKMVQEIDSRPEYEGKMVLICWEHHAIPDIARAFGAKDAPGKWHGESFDRIWVLTFQDDKTTFRDLPQKLMFGDAKE
jgi:hypothetical protein